MHTTSHQAISPRSCADDEPSDGEPSDEALLVGLGRGDQGAGGAFVRRFQRRVYGLAKSIVGDPTQAEDIAQEALSRAWRHAETYDSRRGSVSNWVLTMTRNLAVDALRRKGAEPADPRAVIFLDQPAQGPVPEEAAIIADHTNRVRDRPGPDPRRAAPGPHPGRLLRLYGPRDQRYRGDPPRHGQDPSPLGPDQGAGPLTPGRDTSAGTEVMSKLARRDRRFTPYPIKTQEGASVTIRTPQTRQGLATDLISAGIARWKGAGES